MNAGATSSAVGKSISGGSPNGTGPRPQVTATRRSASGGTEKPGTSPRISSMTPPTERAIGPAWSKLGASGNTPSIGTSPKVGLSPTTPQQAAGILIEPPVSLPSAPSTAPSASAAAEPPLEPPAVRSGNAGFGTTP